MVIIYISVFHSLARDGEMWNQNGVIMCTSILVSYLQHCICMFVCTCVPLNHKVILTMWYENLNIFLSHSTWTDIHLKLWTINNINDTVKIFWLLIIFPWKWLITPNFYKFFYKFPHNFKQQICVCLTICIKAAMFRHSSHLPVTVSFFPSIYDLVEVSVVILF